MFVFLWKKNIQLQDQNIIQAFLHFPICKTRVLENFTLKQQVWISHKELERSLRILLAVFSPSMFLTTAAKESLLKQFPEWGVQKCSYVLTLSMLVLWNSQIAKATIQLLRLPNEPFFPALISGRNLNKDPVFWNHDSFHLFVFIAHLQQAFSDITRVFLLGYYIPSFLRICAHVSLCFADSSWLSPCWNFTF